MAKGLTAAQLASAPTLTPDQYYFLLGLAFSQSQRYIFAAGEVKHFWIDPSAYVPVKANAQEIGIIVGEVPTFFAASGPLDVDFYSAAGLGTAVAAPLAMPLFNRDANSSNAAQMALSLLDKAPDVPGVNYSQLLVPANAAGGGIRVGFSSQESLPFVLGATPIHMKVTNQDGNDTDVGIRFNWFEI